MNYPPQNVLRTIVSGDCEIAISSDGDLTTNIFLLHFPSLTWKFMQNYKPQLFLQYGSIGYRSFFVRNDVLNMFLPYQHGTRVWQLDLVSSKSCRNKTQQHNRQQQKQSETSILLTKANVKLNIFLSGSHRQFFYFIK